MLTKLHINRITEETETPTKRLPDGLLSFDCWGSSVFIELARCELLCTQLTELVSSPGAIDGRIGLGMPFVPVSLLRLHIKGETYFDQYNWSCLEACTNLEKLTLPCDGMRSGLWDLVKHMRHLRMMDFERNLGFVMKLRTKVYCLPG